MRGKHSDSIMQLKSRFLKEKREYLHDAASKVVAMAKEANQVQITFWLIRFKKAIHVLALS